MNETDRLMQVAEALEIPAGLFHSQGTRAERGEPALSSALRTGPLQTVLELRLLRAFQDLTELRTKEVLVHLAEQIVKRQLNPRGGGG